MHVKDTFRTRLHEFNRISWHQSPVQRLQLVLPIALCLHVTQTLVIVVRVKVLQPETNQS